MTNLRIEIGNASDAYLKRMFSWLAKIGAGPKFGSRPIGWYQQHMIHAIEHLEKSKAAGLPVRCNHGMIQAKPTIGHWFDVVTVNQLFDQADYLCRQ